VERRLKEELSARESDLTLIRRNLPPNLSLRKTPAFYSMLVAHRRWQHAYEKLMVLRHEARV